MHNNMSNNTKAVMGFIKAHPGCTVLDIAKGMDTTNNLASRAANSLYNSRYISREMTDQHNASGLPLYGYTFKTDKPRKRSKKSKAKRRYTIKFPKVAVTPVTATLVNDGEDDDGIEILVAFKGEKGTTTMTLDQARRFARKFRI